MTYHFYFKNSEPVYETEYKQSLKQFAVQEIFPAYVLKRTFYLLGLPRFKWSVGTVVVYICVYVSV